MSVKNSKKLKVKRKRNDKNASAVCCVLSFERDRGPAACWVFTRIITDLLHIVD
jgi:hypothetical protein